MDLMKKGFLFSVGGGTYVALELLWRGRSHSSMFFAGGSSFLLLGTLDRHARHLPVLLKSAVGAGMITAVELLTGLIANRSYRVWDYRDLPLNYKGQICLPFSLLWMPLSLAAMGLYEKLDTLYAVNASSRRR